MTVYQLLGPAAPLPAERCNWQECIRRFAASFKEYMAGERCDARAMVYFDLRAYQDRVGNTHTKVAATPVCAPRMCSKEAIGQILGPQMGWENFKYHERRSWPILDKEVFVEIQEGASTQCIE